MRFLTFSRRSVAAGMMSLLLLGCTAPDPLGQAQIPMGDFALGFNIVVADNMQQVPPHAMPRPKSGLR